MNLMVVSGNLGRDIEIRYTQNGKAIGSFPLPVKQGYGEHEKTSWVDVKILGERADKLAPYLTKGKEVTVSGEFVYEQWEKDGVKHGKPVLILSSIDLHGGNNSQQTSQQTSQQKPAQQPRENRSASAPAQSSYDSFGDMDESIPF